jgi:hypothetical protein
VRGTTWQWCGLPKVESAALTFGAGSRFATGHKTLLRIVGNIGREDGVNLANFPQMIGHLNSILPRLY